MSRPIVGGLAALTIAPVAAIALGAPAASGTNTDPETAGAGMAERCRVVRLQEPRWGHDGGVMDIERMNRRVYYYGNTYRVGRDGEEHQRALVWRSRRAAPERVGPRGYDADIALELTDTGLINGVSEDWSTNTTVAWARTSTPWN